MGGSKHYISSDGRFTPRTKPATPQRFTGTATITVDTGLQRVFIPAEVSVDVEWVFDTYADILLRGSITPDKLDATRPTPATAVIINGRVITPTMVPVPPYRPDPLEGGWRVAWVNDMTGEEGVYGDSLPRDYAQAWADAANEANPGVRHWVISGNTSA